VTFLQGIEFFERQWIDWTHEAEVSFKLASSTGSGRTFGKFGTFAGDCDIGFAVEVASKRFTCCYDTHLDFRMINFGSLQSFAYLAETAFLIGTLTTKAIESTGDTASSLRLLTTTLTEIAEATFNKGGAILNER
jgi:hypothetical protein